MSKVFLSLLFLINFLFARSQKFFEYRVSPTFSKQKSTFYVGVLKDIYFNYHGTFDTEVYENFDIQATQKLSLYHSFGFGRSIQLKSQIEFSPLIELYLSNKRFIYPLNNLISINGTYLRFRSRSIGLGIQPSIVYKVYREKLDKLGYHLDLGVLYTQLSGSLDYTYFVQIRSGLSFSLYRKSSKTRNIAPFIRYGIRYACVVHGDTSYGMIYGEKIGFPVEKIQYYPKHETMLYCSFGLRKVHE